MNIRMTMPMKKWARTAVAALAGISIAWSAASADAATTHIASKTTTFWTLSQYYGLTVQQIAKANPSVDANNIAVGSRLAIPTPDTAKEKTATAMKMMESTSDQQLIAGGKTYDVAKTVQATATAYTAAASENGKWGALDYFGNSLKVGTVAVDPSLIALGTKLYIVGYDYDGLPVGGMLASASDMGSSIKGNRIDIFVPGNTSQAKSFGMQYVKVYVLKS
ncbi:3D domain protein [Paenibacillus curdlanolyticus YK9]|uniref:3D domain protein n=1 Tax=Paenibacillus curdlanolyticus YK9 TaxID=717606 RepID=E0IFM5_9BACL|nr:3D domain-containing protein [Paenibacillus curdlanolyticus]EFM08691.1 3D domain protein [Paenibacillus curdlanolyticus YK9]